MAILQTKKQSDLEKRLKFLRQQIYGRESVASNKQYVVSEEMTPKNTHTTNLLTDVTYLKGDLAKISLLASAALGMQILLYFLMKNHILNFIKI